MAKKGKRHKKSKSHSRKKRLNGVKKHNNKRIEINTKTTPRPLLPESMKPKVIITQIPGTDFRTRETVWGWN